MSPFTEDSSGSFVDLDTGTETAFESEFRRVGLSGNRNAKALHKITTEIVNKGSSNFERMAARLTLALSHKPELRKFICEMYVRALYKTMHPTTVPVGGHIRTTPTSSSAPDLSRTAPVKSKPPRAPSPRPIGRPLTKLFGDIYSTRRTGDGKLWAYLSYSEIVSRARDGGIAQRCANHIGRAPDDLSKPLHELINEDTFARLSAE